MGMQVSLRRLPDGACVVSAPQVVGQFGKIDVLVLNAAIQVRPHEKGRGGAGQDGAWNGAGRGQEGPRLAGAPVWPAATRLPAARPGEPPRLPAPHPFPGVAPAAPAPGLAYHTPRPPPSPCPAQRTSTRPFLLVQRPCQRVPLPFPLPAPRNKPQYVVPSIEETTTEIVEDTYRALRHCPWRIRFLLLFSAAGAAAAAPFPAPAEGALRGSQALPCFSALLRVWPPGAVGAQQEARCACWGWGWDRIDPLCEPAARHLSISWLHELLSQRAGMVHTCGLRLACPRQVVRVRGGAGAATRPHCPRVSRKSPLAGHFMIP